MDENNISLINMIINMKKDELLKLVNQRENPNDEAGKHLQQLILSIHKAQEDFMNTVKK